ncbi:unnamed protein product [Acanthocheilonema viteae]|uniref:Uncharacterized protein n=1 Tax=Acanthocheilonema viteae TaxID=6277 RepID=A0A498SG84_ACAVI|nr:unnamed protein product [Acanthocheilonema viteae]
MTVAVAITMIISIVLCLKKKNSKKDGLNFTQKTFTPNKNKEKVHEIDRYNDGSKQFPDSDNKEAFYPPVAEPTPSTKRKREEELEKDKEEKIREGFYQSRSDEDDTLEPIKSLKDEETDPADKSNASRKIKRMKNASQRTARNAKLKTHANDEKKNEK